MKTWKIQKNIYDVVAYVNVSDNDTERDTAFYSLELVRNTIDKTVNGYQLLADGEEKKSGVPELSLYYPEVGSVIYFNNYPYTMEKLHISAWTNEASASVLDANENRFLMIFDSKQNLKPIDVELSF